MSRAGLSPHSDLARGEAFSRRHAVLCLAAAAFAIALRQPAICGVAGAVSLFAFALRSERPRALGAANLVTLLRLLLVLVLSITGLRAGLAGGLVLAVFVLDGVDGALARRLGTSSVLGARLDMESDALLVLVASVVLYTAGRLDAFVLVMGLLRYAYVVVLAIIERVRGRPVGEAPRSRLARAVLGLVATSLVLSCFDIEPIHRPLSVVVTVLLVASFARSLHAALSAASASK